MSSKEKKKSFKNTFKNIPTGARITILIIVIFGVAASFLTINAFSSGDEANKNEVALPSAGKSKVDIGAKYVEGFKVGGEKILDENSPMAKAEKEARSQEIERAKQEPGGGYMPPLELNSGRSNSTNSNRSDFIDSLLADVDKNASQKLDSERSSRPVPNGLDDVTDREAEYLARQERLNNMESELLRSQDERSNMANSGQARSVRKIRAYPTATIDIQGAINTEKQHAGGIGSKVLAQASQISGSQMYAFGGGGGSPSSGRNSVSGSGQSSNGYNPADDPNNPAYFEPYVNNERHIPKPDYEGLSNARSQVMAAMGQNSYGSQASAGGGQGQQSAGYQFGSESISNGEYGQAASNGYSSQGSSSTASSAPNKPYKAIGDVCYGRLKMNVNSDTPTPVRIKFLDQRCSKLFNATAVAQPARQGEHVTLDLKGVNVNGKTQSINAIALDPKSESALFQDDLDRHIMSRYVSLAGAAALPGWSDAVTGVNVEEDEDGNETRTTPPVDALTDQLAVIAGSIGDAIVPILQKNFNRPPTVKVYNNRDVLIMFMGDFNISP